MEDKTQKNLQKRVFISDVDKYSSKHIAEFLSTCVSDEGEETGASSPGGEASFRIVGTVSAPSTSGKDKPNFILEQYMSLPREELLERLLQCDVVMYNITEGATQQQVDEATWAITALYDEMENFSAKKMFILISTVMTWAKTKPRNPEERNVLLTEDEFIRRRPHPSFKNHKDLEILVLKLGRGKKSKLRGYVVGCGLQYGMGENIFHYFFKASWLQIPKVPLFGEGTNYIPMIHVYDIGGIIQNIIEVRPKSKYILAVDDSKSTLEDIVKKISGALGSGKVDKVPEQEAITMKAFKPEELQYLSIDLRMDTFIIKDSFSLQWTSEEGMLENMEKIVEEYKNTRQLFPIRVCVVGPPAVGKSTVAEKLCRDYRIHHIRIKELIEENVKQLTEIAAGADTEHEETKAAAQKQLENLNKSMEANEGRLPDFLLFDILREKLNSKPCQNQGFVLDGFPKTYEQAKLIFLDEDAEIHPYKAPAYNKKITPEHVFELNASDDFLIKRAQELPQSVAEEMRYTEEEFIPRLKRYRDRSAAEEIMLDYFDEHEIHPELFDVEKGDSECKDVMRKITEVLGSPSKYSLSVEEQEEEVRKKEEEKRKKEVKRGTEASRRREAELEETVSDFELWKKTLSEVERQDQEMQEAQALPIRNYLMKYVTPTLTEAMAECCRIKPEDPVDFVAEYLLRKVPQE